MSLYKKLLTSTHTKYLSIPLTLPSQSVRALSTSPHLRTDPDSSYTRGVALPADGISSSRSVSAEATGADTQAHSETHLDGASRLSEHNEHRDPTELFQFREPFKDPFPKWFGFQKKRWRYFRGGFTSHLITFTTHYHSPLSLPSSPGSMSVHRSVVLCMWTH